MLLVVWVGLVHSSRMPARSVRRHGYAMMRERVYKMLGVANAVVAITIIINYVLKNC